MPRFEVALFDSGTAEESIKRGLAAFFTLLLIDVIYHSILYKRYSKVYGEVYIYVGDEKILKKERLVQLVGGLINSWALLCSAVSINIPEDYGVPAIWGAVVGLLAYGIFNVFFNAIQPEKWPLSFVIVDIVKGVCATSLSSVVSAAVFFSINDGE
uniref:Uncharacterized protein n=1 Tax=Aplanochytrium stocchinoi TaxID=215587 RepID=A0A7S3PC85_9STRA|mmetsp:Transcript_5387/g.6814  ORF Transcript_5387/g.6814 Transcript_5387/m.6814 type:complete len:156 (-) Transcript_5387:104-571(-)|eukprot:CAMPEP_0204891312 /NCGR_PEP_ID=MMETSP1349-20130617/26942_1 /ASSEMBLY_ACC=CAM_ASM_000710 /TAXON_ID=215587 /ORGANISM="Aplanochytrium stocchinoi, Strain GSBS06" /LENGTH=155 /DNA_ID=CAMNT_0052056581 /DNA_START=202 /DNA_END=669 /DNA_ORIENTATION=-